MYYAYKYRLKPSDAHREELDHHRDICRQLYNHALHRFNQIPEGAGTFNQRVRSIRDELPALKEWWDGLSDVYSTVLQTAVMRIEQNVKSLGGLKKSGYGVGVVFNLAHCATERSSGAMFRRFLVRRG